MCDPDGFRFAAGVLGCTGAERGGKVQGFHGNTLVEDNFNRKGGIESSGKEGEGFA
jgi:hypothetical protein